MATSKTSQAQQAPMPGMDAWRSMWADQAKRAEQIINEFERMDRERHERMVQSLDHVSALLRSTIEYQTKLSAEWRKLGLEAMRQGAAMMTPPEA